MFATFPSLFAVPVVIVSRSHSRKYQFSIWWTSASHSKPTTKQFAFRSWPLLLPLLRLPFQIIPFACGAVKTHANSNSSFRSNERNDGKWKERKRTRNYPLVNFVQCKTSETQTKLKWISIEIRRKKDQKCPRKKHFMLDGCSSCYATHNWTMTFFWNKRNSFRF